MLNVDRVKLLLPNCCDNATATAATIVDASVSSMLCSRMVQCLYGSIVVRVVVLHRVGMTCVRAGGAQQ
jgi:hypothetical protein